MRQCLLCRERMPKVDMLRLVVDDEGQIWSDLMQKLDGRGAYLCMQDACVATLSDKRLGMLKKDFVVAWPQAQLLKDRLRLVLELQLKQQFLQAKSVLNMGRDAVMHSMWDRGSLLVVLSDTAGDALVRQVHDAAEKRKSKGFGVTVCDSFPGDVLANIFERDTLSVIALKVTEQTKKLKKYCSWYGCMKRNQD